MPLFPPQKYRNVEYIHRQGLAADRPLAGNVLKGTLYFSTDTLTLERSNGTTWTAYAGTGAIPGPPGPTGPTGAIGPQGGQGSPGVDGSDGEDGAMGSPGPIGPRGFTGIQGIQGLIGPIGPFGFDGIDGDEGFMGPSGPRGLQGIQGPAGTGGSSSVPAFLTFDGEDGEEGARGPTGSQGIQGIQGLRGFQGPPGYDGEDGVDPIMMLMGASGGIPGGISTQVQFNDAGVFGGSSLFTYDKTTGQMDSKRVVAGVDGLRSNGTLVVVGITTLNGAVITGSHVTVGGNLSVTGTLDAGGLATVGGLQSNAYVYATSFVQAGTDFYEKSRSSPVGHYVDWVPTFTNLTVGNGTLYAKEMRVGRTTFFAILLVFGSTTAVTGQVTFTVPRAGVTLANAQSVARVMVLHGGYFYAGQTWLASPTEHYIMFAGVPMVTMDPITPITWAAASQLFINGFYGEA